MAYITGDNDTLSYVVCPKFIVKVNDDYYVSPPMSFFPKVEVDCCKVERIVSFMALSKMPGLAQKMADYYREVLNDDNLDTFNSELLHICSTLFLDHKCESYLILKKLHEEIREKVRLKYYNK